MKNLLTKYILTAATVVVAFTASQQAQAQTAAVTATATVQNTLTLATASQLNFGTIAAVGQGATNSASVDIDTAGVLSVATTGGTAVTALVDSALATVAQVTIDDGADGATINVTIDNVVDPTDGTNAFILAGFVTSLNGNPEIARTAATPFTMVYDAAFGGGLNTLDIGASITTNATLTGAYNDAPHIGGFDVIFSY